MFLLACVILFTGGGRVCMGRRGLGRPPLPGNTWDTTGYGQQIDASLFVSISCFLLKKLWSDLIQVAITNYKYQGVKHHFGDSFHIC